HAVGHRAGDDHTTCLTQHGVSRSPGYHASPSPPGKGRAMARTARIVSGPAALLLSVGLLSAPEPAAAAPVTSPADAPGSAVTVQVDPSYRHPVFEGWGTSLVWFANITGGYPDEIRRKLVDMVFGEDGLWLTIARYNIGGGNAPDVRRDYMKVGATKIGRASCRERVELAVVAERV